MIRPQRYFPWKIARQFYFGHLAFVFVVLIVTGFSLRFYAYSEFLAGGDIHVQLARFDNYLTSLFVTVLLISAVYLAFSTRIYTRPLGRLIQKARELRRLDLRSTSEASNAKLLDPGELEDEPGEWSDLERALSRLHKDLRKKTVDLSREREELSALIGAVSEAILAVDREGHPLFFNPQFALRFGTTRGAQAKTLTLGEMFRVPDVLKGYRDVLESGQMRIVASTLHVTDSPMPRHFAISIAPLRSEEAGPIYGALGIFHDVTELKQAEQIRIEFVGNASHELRTPITSIKGYVETLRDDLKLQRYDSALQFIDIISRNVDRMTYLVTDLLDLSALESGEALIRMPVITREITEATLKHLDAKRLARKQQIFTHFEAETLLADPRRVEQVLVNLIHNAIKYTPEGSRIDVTWSTDGRATVLKVKDNGPGIAPEHQARLFERFYRVDAGRSRDAGGTGLGLAIVKHIMIKHGGSARLVSKGEGAEFICTFGEP